MRSDEIGMLMHQQRPKLARLATSFLGSSANMDDINEVVSAATEATWKWVRRQMDDGNNGAPDANQIVCYLHGCTRYSSYRFIRRLTSHRSLEEQFCLDIRRNNHPNGVDEEDVRFIDELIPIAQLNSHENRVIDMYLKGYKHHEIAAETGRTPVAVRQTYSRAVKKLRIAAMTLFPLVVVALFSTYLLSARSPRFRWDADTWQIRTGLWTWKEVVPSSRYGYLSPPDKPHVPGWRHIDLDDDGKKEFVVLSLDAERAGADLGAIRLDRVNSSGVIQWTYWDDDPLRYDEGRTEFSGHEFTYEDVHFFDWTGDGRSEIVVISTHLYYPSKLLVVDAGGRKIFEYVQAGHMKSMVRVSAGFQEALIKANPWYRSPDHAREAVALSAFFQESKMAGIVYLPVGMSSSSSPSQGPRYRNANLEPAQEAIFLRFPPTAVAAARPAGHSWPANIEFEKSRQRIRVGSIELPEDFVLLRYIDAQLNLTAAVATDRLVNEHRRLTREEPELPALNAPEFVRSVETVEIYKNGEWVPERHHGAWGRDPVPIP